MTPIQVNVYTESPGLAAEDVEKLLTFPMETAMASLPGWKKSVPCRCSGCPSSASISRTMSISTSPAGWSAKNARSQVANARRLRRGHRWGRTLPRLGQVFWYTVESADQKLSAMDLRTLQDWNVRLLLRTAAGVDDVTSWGRRREKQYQVLIQPHKLIKYGISFKTVMEALAANNPGGRGQYVNLGREQYTVRGLGLVAGTAISAISSSPSAKVRRSMFAMSPEIEGGSARPAFRCSDP
ncbi:MAG: efflux RND transporter permease subunit [Comamonadaceae bacterium]|uniref:efflux RND transporter permease subunit n=1 Tax=Candidatus Skiveiella danica TaxID=3386177 RepID=UPI00390BBAF9|nr:efflux RND transporter permease subunit [Comamonadaceae bacterium]